MTVNLDVLMYLARIALCVAGVMALIYLCLMFKSVIATMQELQETLKAVTIDLSKLESPLDTLGQVSKTVDSVQSSAKQAAMGAIQVFSQGTEKLSNKLKDSSAARKNSAENKVQSELQEVTKNLNKIDEDLDKILPNEKPQA